MISQDFLVDQFILEVGEGYMPAPHSEERQAYEAWRDGNVSKHSAQGVAVRRDDNHVGTHRAE